MRAAQEHARERFDLERTWAALPPPPPPPSEPTSYRGAAGVRLRGHLKATLPDDALRVFARVQLGARRIRADYLDALRVTLGNQTGAERWGYTLEMNIRTDFAPERGMRSIIDQMKAADITVSKRVGLGSGRVQVVQVFNPNPAPVPDLCTVLRWEEGQGTPADIPEGITADAVPY